MHIVRWLTASLLLLGLFGFAPILAVRLWADEQVEDTVVADAADSTPTTDDAKSGESASQRVIPRPAMPRRPSRPAISPRANTRSPIQLWNYSIRAPID